MDKKTLMRVTAREIKGVGDQIRAYENFSIQLPIPGFDSEGRLPTLHQYLMAQELVRSKGLIVASSTGAGKTLVGWLGYHMLDKNLKGRNARALVISPNQAADSAWTAEKLGSYSTALDQREQSVLRVHAVSDLEAAASSDFVVMNDDKLARGSDLQANKAFQQLAALGKNHFDLVVLDEGHRERNKAANRTRAVDALLTQVNPDSARLVLTATPMWNGPNDIGMLLHYVDPKTIADPHLFDYTRDHAAAARVIRKYVFHSSRDDLRKSVGIPDLVSRVHEVGLRPQTRRDYMDLWENNQGFFDFLWGAREILAEEKLRYLERSGLVEDIARGDMDSKGRRQVVIFTQLRDRAGGFTRRLEEMYQGKGFDVVRIDGSVPVNRREKLAERFRSGEAEIAIVTDKTMGEGVHLNAHPETGLPASIVSVDEDFAPGARFQREGRIVRPGAPGVAYYHELRAVDSKLSAMMKKRVRALAKSQGLHVSDWVMDRFDGATLDENAARVSSYKAGTNQKVLAAEPLDELQAALASTDFSKSSATFRSLCTYSNLINLIPTDTPSHVATLIATRWNGRGIQNLEQLTDKPLQQLYVDMYEVDYEHTSSAHTARLLEQVVGGLEDAVGGFENIVDLGSGAAYTSRIMKRPMVCVDLWKKMLDLGEEKCKKDKRLKGNSYVQAKMQETELDSESVELAIASYSLQYQAQGVDQKSKRVKRELEDAVMEANRIIMHGGFYLVALPRSIAGSAYQNFNRKLSHFGFEVSDVSGEYVVREAFDLKGKRRVKKAPSQSRFKSVYITLAQKVGDANGYLSNADDFVLYRPKSTSLMLGVKGRKAPEKADISTREICTKFGKKVGGKVVGVEDLVRKYTEGFE